MILLRFDADGNQLGELPVTFPDHCFQEKYTGHEAHQELVRQRAAFLRETLGHQPGLIRVKSIHFNGSTLVGDYEGGDPDPMGYPDDPERSPDDDSYWGPCGFGGSVHGWISRSCFVYTGGTGGVNCVSESGIVWAT
jgi:hypothetical protein